MNWENLNAGEFKSSLGTTGGVCLFPIGCLEKHGDHLPLGTDIAIAREIARRAAAIEEFMIFPCYPFGFVSEVRHKLGTVSLEAGLQFQILEQTCNEIARNGYKKIVFGNGHGGNNDSLRAFAVALLDKRRDYVVYVCNLWGLSREQGDRLAATHGTPADNNHADRVETADMMAIDGRRVHMDRVNITEGRALGRMDALDRLGVYTSLNWYADYPNQIAGDPTGASADYGNDILNFNAENLVAVIREIKRNEIPARLHAAFYRAAEQPEA